MKNKPKFTYVDLFSGIGGFRVAADKLNGKSQGYSEIDRFAIETYKKNFDDPVEHNLGDITKITNLPKIDLLMGGVPCQSWSVAGKKLGFDDPRGKLWFDTIKMVKISRPKVFIFENVKGLADPRNHKSLQLLKTTFKNMKYITFDKVLNTYDFGQPQNRSRIFLIGFRKDLENNSKLFEYPTNKKPHKELIDFLDNIEKKKIIKKKFTKEHLFNGKVPLSRNASQKNDELNDFFVLCDTRNGHSTIHSWDIRETNQIEKNICMSILKNRRKKKYGDSDGNPMSFEDIKELVKDATIKNINDLVKKKILRYTKTNKIDLVNSKNSSGIDGIYRVFLPNSTIFSTLTATGTRDYIATEYITGDSIEDYKNNFIKNILKKNKIRQITTKEAHRIQGFPKKFKIHPNDRHASKQIGNSVSPIVVESVLKNIIDTGVFDN